MRTSVSRLAVIACTLFLVQAMIPSVTLACPEDTDGDGICDTNDNCPLVVNPDQSDVDADGLGDVCDPCPLDPTNSCGGCNDTDGDGVCDEDDADPFDPFVCRDVDADTCDDCSSGTDNPADDGPDFDGDGLCDQGDTDDDNDGIPDVEDPCPFDPTNSCQCPDQDQDGICDPDDNCPFIPNPNQEDVDGDGLGDLCDPCPEDPTNSCGGCVDTDGDGICDEDDNCPFVANADQSDIDLDGLGDVCDPCPSDPDNSCAGCEQLPGYTESWWPGDGHEEDLLGRHPLTETLGTPTFAPGRVLEGFKFSGSDGYVVPHGFGLDIGEYGSMSLLAWVRVDEASDVARTAIVDKRTGTEPTDVGYLLYVQSHDAGSLTVGFRMSDGVAVQEIGTGPIPYGTFHHVAVVLDRYRETVAIYLDGRLAEMQPEAVGNLANDSGFHIGHPSRDVGTQVVPFHGVIDELQFFRDSLSWCGVSAVHAAGGDGICRGDADGDGVVDYEDNCPTVSNSDQGNQDPDPAGDVCDCAPLDPGVFRAPGEAGGLLHGTDRTKDGVAWCAVGYQTGGDTVYTVVRGLLSELPVGSGGSETCLASALSPSFFTDPSAPPAGDGFWYVLRAGNSCGIGVYGYDSAGGLRGGPIPYSCPMTEEELCWDTGGTWDPGSCGHYVCDAPPDCDAIIPGCDCGPGRSFGPGIGCFDDPQCD